MGFKCINQSELNTRLGPNFLGMPIRYLEEINQMDRSKTEGMQASEAIHALSEISIINEESIEFQYNHDLSKDSIEGFGTISIFNNSGKNRIWDAQLSLLGTKYSNLDEYNEMNLGIFEPKTSKNIKYNYKNMDILPEILIINEDIEVLNEEIRVFKNFEEILENDQNFDKGYNLLLQGKENIVNFIIELENTSQYILNDILLRKVFDKNFYDISCKSESQSNFKISRNKIEWTKNELKPGQKVRLSITGKIHPEKIEKIRTGKIEITCQLKDYVISETRIENFSAYSHAMHVINALEKETEPNKWQCSLSFANHSEFSMHLKSILITDDSKSTKFMDRIFKNDNKISIRPNEIYKTDVWEIDSEIEPKFARKIGYSVDSKIERNTNISMQIADDKFEIIGFNFEKNISQNQIKSFEVSEIRNNIIIQNTGTIPISGIVVKEKIPADFLPMMNNEDIQMKNSSGDINLDDIVLDLSPFDDDPAKEHDLELKLNLNDDRAQDLLQINEFLELNYTTKAVNPDYKKDYEFPLEIRCFYAKNKDHDLNDNTEFYVLSRHLSDMKNPKLKIIHKRRNLAIGKEIFPGRDDDEFAISIIIRNKSIIEVKDLLITDTIPKTFEIVSSNMKRSISDSTEKNQSIISFQIKSVLPYQEKEIMYYVKSKDGKDVNFSKLESFFYA
jgi:hypothetical protein